jgi:hypothetical protein
LPVPSTMVPPRITMSCMKTAPALRQRNDAPASSSAQRLRPRSGGSATHDHPKQPASRAGFIR